MRLGGTKVDAASWNASRSRSSGRRSESWACALEVPARRPGVGREWDERKVDEEEEGVLGAQAEDEVRRFPFGP